MSGRGRETGFDEINYLSRGLPWAINWVLMAQSATVLSVLGRLESAMEAIEWIREGTLAKRSRENGENRFLDQRIFFWLCLVYVP